jgi:hypothetical protein
MKASNLGVACSIPLTASGRIGRHAVLLACRLFHFFAADIAHVIVAMFCAVAPAAYPTRVEPEPAFHSTNVTFHYARLPSINLF